MVATVLVYAGLVLGGVGAVSLVRPLAFCGLRTRSQAAVAVGAGALVIVVGVLLPV